MSQKEYRLYIRQINGEEAAIDCKEGESLLTALLRHGIRYRTDCAGRGTCGKCKIQVIEGDFLITAQDLRLFSEEDLQKGYRLACKAYPKGDCNIALLSVTESVMEVVTESRMISGISNQVRTAAVKDKNKGMKQQYGIAIDLGTTTLAMNLLELPVGTVCHSYSAINPQREYGADVLSRMNASIDGAREKLQSVIINSLWKGILTLLQESGVTISEIITIAIAGNTTMGHLFLGYSCETLGVFPFSPVNIGTHSYKAGELFTENRIKKEQVEPFNEITKEQWEHWKEIPLTLLPGISTFVGGDIVSGLAVCGFHAMIKPCLLIDFGTNGELAIGNRDKIMVTSTAAGPAFEGGNISCGVGSIPGAISHFVLKGGKASYETIGNQAPVGVCGTGVVEIAAELLKAGLIDDTGLFCETYFASGYPITHHNDRMDNDIIFTQKDIRELQLAKAAVRAGIEVLVQRYGITLQDLQEVYLAGGFGFRMDVAKAVQIGLLPQELQNKIKVIGNSSLAGAAAYLTDTTMKDSLEQIISVSKEIHLSNEEDFNELYLQYMSF